MQAWFHVHEWSNSLINTKPKKNHNTVSITCHPSLKSLRVRPLASQRISSGFTRNTSASLLEEDWCSCFLLPPPAIRSFTSLQTVYTHRHKREQVWSCAIRTRDDFWGPPVLQCFEHVPNHFQPLRVFVGFNVRTVEIVKWWVHVGRWCCQTYPQDKMLIFNHIVYGT